MAEGITNTKKIELPPLVFRPWFLELLGQIAQNSVLNNIKFGKQADGQQLKRNAPSTIKAKRAAALPVIKALVAYDQSLYRGRGQSFSWETKKTGNGYTITIRPATPDAIDRTRKVQEMGYVGWFGLSKTASGIMAKAMKEYVFAFFKAMKEGRDPNLTDISVAQFGGKQTYGTGSTGKKAPPKGKKK